MVSVVCFASFEKVTSTWVLDWYDNEHAPLRLTVPGFLSASRYKALDAPPKSSPKWLALYDLTSKEVMQSQAYKDLRLKASDNERQVVGNLEMLNRRVYELLYSSKSEAGDGGEKAAKFMYVVHMQVMGSKEGTDRAGQESHFIDWYTSTRIPLLVQVPGYLRSRVYRLAEHTELAGRAPTTSINENTPYKFLAIHEWSMDGAVVVDSSEFKMCMTDAEPWKMEGEEVVAEMEDRLFALYKVFE